MPKISKEEYLKTHLQDMDEIRRQWYITKMETWTGDDYARCTNANLEMLGEPSEEDVREAQRIIRERQRRLNR